MIPEPGDRGTSPLVEELFIHLNIVLLLKSLEHGNTYVVGTIYSLLLVFMILIRILN